jgi:hypothetical protein
MPSASGPEVGTVGAAALTVVFVNSEADAIISIVTKIVMIFEDFCFEILNFLPLFIYKLALARH